MQYIAYIFGIFGLLAYLEVSSLKKRITELERQLSKMSGTSYSENMSSLANAIRTYMGKAVTIELKEDHQDVDISMYGNTKHGKNTILDTDGEWMLVRVESAKGVREKLIRLESVRSIRAAEETE